MASIERSTTRTEHLAWCKARALLYLDSGELTNAVASMISDLTEHDETGLLPLHSLGMAGIHVAAQGDANAVRRWIEGFY